MSELCTKPIQTIMTAKEYIETQLAGIQLNETRTLDYTGYTWNTIKGAISGYSVELGAVWLKTVSWDKEASKKVVQLLPRPAFVFFELKEALLGYSKPFEIHLPLLKKSAHLWAFLGDWNKRKGTAFCAKTVQDKPQTFLIERKGFADLLPNLSQNIELHNDKFQNYSSAAKQEIKKLAIEFGFLASAE